MTTHVIITAQALNADRIIPVLGYKHELVQSVLKDEPVECVLQLGTAHVAILQTKDLLQYFNGDILILYEDVPLIKLKTLVNLLDLHNKLNSESTIITTDLPNPYGYGRIIRDESGNLHKIVEEKDANYEECSIQEINCGIYVFKAQTLFNLLPVVYNNTQNEYYLPDVLNLLLEKKEKVTIEKIKNYFEIQGVNNIEQLNKVNEFYKKE